MIVFCDHHQMGLARRIAPWFVILGPQTLAHGLDQHAHGFTFDSDIAFNPQDIQLLRQADDISLQGVGVGDLSHLDDNRVEVIVVVVMVVMMVVLVIMVMIVVCLLYTSDAADD